MMHLEKPYLTTTRYSKRKKPLSKKLQAAHDDHCAWLEKMGISQNKKSSNTKKKREGIYEIPDYSTGPRMTSDRVAANGVVRKTNTYTGDELLGIGQMHKSNAVPVRKDNVQAAKELASMRR